MKTRNISLFAAMVALTGAAQAADNRVTLTTGVDYSSGKYGGTQATDMTYIPVIGKYESGPYIFKLTVPYIRVTAPSGGTVVSYAQDGTPIRRSSGPITTNSGLGDIVAALSYSVLNNSQTQTFVDIKGKIKFGTADEKKYLGTGKTDFSFQADLYKTYNKTTAFASLGYRVPGSPAWVNMKSAWYGSLGGSYKFSQETSGGIDLYMRQPSTATGAQLRELTAYVTQKMDGNSKIQCYVLKGFSDASPDWGMGAMFSITMK